MRARVLRKHPPQPTPHGRVRGPNALSPCVFARHIGRQPLQFRIAKDCVNRLDRAYLAIFLGTNRAADTAEIHGDGHAQHCCHYSAERLHGERERPAKIYLVGSH